MVYVYTCEEEVGGGEWGLLDWREGGMVDWVACALSVFMTWRTADGGMFSLSSSMTFTAFHKIG